MIRPELRLAGLVLAGILIVDYGLALQMQSLRDNAYDAKSREAFLSIARDAKIRGLTSARIGGTWWFEPEMGFYPRRYRAEWLSPHDVKDPTYLYQAANTLMPLDYDYFLYTRANDPGLKAPRVRTIFHDNKTQLTIIAIDSPLPKP